MLAEDEQGPVVQALRAAALLVSDGRAAAPETWRPVLRQLLADDRSGVRDTALAVTGYWLLDERLEAELAQLALLRRRNQRPWNIVQQYTPLFARWHGVL